MAQDFQPTVTLMGQPAEMGVSKPAQDLPTDQIILKLKANVRQQFNLSQADFEHRLSQTAGSELRELRPMSGDALVFRLGEKLPYEQVLSIAERLEKLPEVVYAEPDRIMQIAFIPNDTYYSAQWDLFDTYGINAPNAWNWSTGNSNIVVGVIDTGILFNHPDLQGRILPGYDFISDPYVANDGDGRDSDASDAGDWCGTDNSSWHGSHVAGIIAASTNNNRGIAGINWNSKILPVRVIGKCGGYNSDIIDGMRWGAGLSINGVPNNPNPASVLNLSFGGEGACSPTFQNAINDILAKGVIIVAAAGNNQGSADYFTPANCSGVISVAATNSKGYRASYSNYGYSVDISAPGGDFYIDNGILSTVNSGTTSPTSSYTYTAYQGTSMAAPHVAGVVSLMLSRNPTLTFDQVLSILKSTAKPFPTGSTCNTSICGSGIVNAGDAVYQALPLELSNHLYLPLITKPSQPWTILLNESFEGSFPGSWKVLDDNGSSYGVYYWGMRSCKKYAGNYAAWAIGGGVNGNSLSCGVNYVDYASSWMLSGPYNLSGAMSAEFNGVMWFQTQLGYDKICYMVSLDQTYFYGKCWSGNSNGWINFSLDLSSVPTLGDLRGKSGVYVALLFRSDSSNNYPEGAYVDDLILRECTYAGGCSTSLNESSMPESGGGNWKVEDAMFMYPHP
ncbi:MAG: S8 family serine peptidase [Anaerolineales bacterium]